MSEEPFSNQLTVNVTWGKTGLNYNINKLPEGETLVATFTYGESVRGHHWRLLRIVTTRGTVVEQNPEDERAIMSFVRIEQLIKEHAALV